MIDTTLGWRDDVEICLCDTTGKAMPSAVSELFEAAFRRFPEHSRWAYHAHDTYGFGVATVMAAYQTGVRVFDASIAGLGGCPFAPGATGNVASEDLAYAFGRMGITTGVDLDVLVRAAREVANIDGAVVGGYYRIAWAATQAGDTAFAPA